jgi:acyl carrier protein
VDDNIREIILGLFRDKSQMKDIGEDDRFFDMGVSSLTIIDLQIGVEGVLGITVPTSELMRQGTIRGWIETYSARARHGCSVPDAAIANHT